MLANNKKLPKLCINHRKGKVVRVTTLVVTGDVEAWLQRPQWRLGQSSWRPFRFSDGTQYVCLNLHTKGQHEKYSHVMTSLYWMAFYLFILWKQHSGLSHSFFTTYSKYKDEENSTWYGPIQGINKNRKHDKDPLFSYTAVPVSWSTQFLLFIFLK